MNPQPPFPDFHAGRCTLMDERRRLARQQMKVVLALLACFVLEVLVLTYFFFCL